jgi:D-alanyl-D-alanine carboxypeptidase
LGRAQEPLEPALEARVSAGAPSAMARLEMSTLDRCWAGAAGCVAHNDPRQLRADDAFRVASVSKHVTAAVAVMLDRRGILGLDQPLGDQLDRKLLVRWGRFPALVATTPRQLLSHTAGLPSYFDPQFVMRAAQDPGRRWEPVELADEALTASLPLFEPGRGFSYSDTGYVLVGIVIEQRTGLPLHAVYRSLVFNPAGMGSTWLEGYEPPRHPRIAHHYADGLDMASVSPTIDWAGGGLVSTTADLSRFLSALWSGDLIDSIALQELTRWTPGASFPPGHGLRYDRYGLGLGSIRIDTTELLGHTGYVGAFAFYEPESGATVTGTHNASEVSRWPLVEALCSQLQAWQHEAP